MGLNNEDIVVHTHDKWLLEDITALFNGIFMPRYQTRLVRGKDEPLYRPADEQTPYHQIIFARGFYASALHEIQATL